MTGAKTTFLWLGMVLSVGLVLRGPAAPDAVAQDLFTPRDVARLKSVVSARVSPAGSHIAYVLSVPREPLADENGPSWTELHVMGLGGNSRPYVTGKVNVSEVQWTPDGKAIAFVAKRGEDEHSGLYVIPLNGGEARRLFEHDADVQSVAFSMDGKQLAFLAVQPLPKQQQEYQDKGFNQEVYEEDWQPTQVWIGSADGSGKPRALDLPGSAFSVCWRPSSHELAVALAPRALVDDSYMFQRLRVVDTDTGQVVQRIENPGKLGQVAWSPDGRQLAMISAADENDPAEGRLLLVSVPGDAGPRDLMPDYQAHVNSIAWKDAATLLWVADEGALTTVGAVDLQGQRQVLHGPGQPILSHVSASDDGTHMAFVGHSPQHPPEVFVWQDGQVVRQSDSNPWLEGVQLAKQEITHWNARDGLSLEGIVVYPINHQAGRRYPLIMVVHGGPESHVADGWVTSYSSPGQVGAARGFAVFYPNYRGSTGRGVEFSKMGQADAAGKEFDDLVDGVDHLIEQGLVLKDKVGITGGSYGGYASAWGATYYSDRFAASVMFVGISNNVSKVGTTDIPEEMYLVHHRKRLWEDWEYFLQRSPIRHVEKHKTPILILHGKSDPRAPVAVAGAVPAPEDPRPGPRAAGVVSGRRPWQPECGSSSGLQPAACWVGWSTICRDLAALHPT